MTEIPESEKQELIKILNEIEEKIKETRPKCKNVLQCEILDEIEKKLNTLKK